MNHCGGSLPDDTQATRSYKLNVIMGVLGEWSKELEVNLNKIVGARSSDVLKMIHEVLLSGSLNI